MVDLLTFFWGEVGLRVDFVFDFGSAVFCKFVVIYLVGGESNLEVVVSI